MSEHPGSPAKEPTGETTGGQSLIGRMRKLFENSVAGAPLIPTSEPRSIGTTVQVAWAAGPCQVTIGKTALEFHPDPLTHGGKRGGHREWLVHGGAPFYAGLAGFMRVPSGTSLILGRDDDVQTAAFEFSKSVARRHLEVVNRNGALTLKPLDTDRICTIRRLDGNDETLRVHNQRRRNLDRLSALFHDAIHPLARAEALDLISRVNRILAAESYRERDSSGNPGGIITLPKNVTPLIVGDIHTRIDNLSRVIAEGGFLQALERKEACLVLLGDLIHSQETGELEEMQSSTLILDAFLLLKERFPDNVFYVRGNHESFSSDVGKAGIAQGVLYRKHLRKTRGKAYVSEVEKLFDGLAFIVQGPGFAACHGAPTRSDVNRETLVNIRRYPGIQHEIIWNRLRQGNRPGGYTKGSIKRFRRTLGLAKHASLVVAHTPLSDRDTVWLDVAEITGHHVVYSAHLHRVGAIMMAGETAVPLEYPAEPLSHLFGSDGPED